MALSGVVAEAADRLHISHSDYLLFFEQKISIQCLFSFLLIDARLGRITFSVDLQRLELD